MLPDDWLCHCCGGIPFQGPGLSWSKTQPICQGTKITVTLVPNAFDKA